MYGVWKNAIGCKLAELRAARSVAKFGSTRKHSEALGSARHCRLEIGSLLTQRDFDPVWKDWDEAILAG